MRDARFVNGVTISHLRVCFEYQLGVFTFWEKEEATLRLRVCDIRVSSSTFSITCSVRIYIGKPVKTWSPLTAC